MAGYEGDAHEVVNRRAVPLAQRQSVSLISAVEEIAINDADVRQALGNIPPEIMGLLYSPELYIGDAKEKALAIAASAEAYVS